MIAAWLGCHDPEPSPPSPPDSTAPPDGHSAVPGTTDPDAPYLRCALGPDNPLRGRCDVTWAEAGPVELRLSASGEEDRVFVDDGPAVEHDMAFWGLVPATTWTVTATNAATGEVRDVLLRSGPLPPDFDRLRVDVERYGRSRVDGVVFAPTCPAGYVVAVDRWGRVVWYQDTEPDGAFDGGIDALSVTDRGTVLLVVGRDSLRELGFDGAVVQELLRGRDFDDVVHHDAIGAGGYTFALSARVETIRRDDYVIDSVLVFDASGAQVATVDTFGVVPLVEEPWMQEGYWSSTFPGAVDLTHANALYRDASGDLWVSFRHQFAFARFAGDPLDPAFGEAELLVAGDRGSPSWDAADVRVGGGPQAPFSGQHDVRFGPGGVTLFDNGFPYGRDSEATRYVLDEAAGTLTWVEGWGIGRACTTQGAMRPLGRDHWLTTCASIGVLQEFASGVPASTWTAYVTCDDQPVVLPEGVPLALPTAPAPR